MDLEKYISNILSVVNGQNAWDFVAKISQFNRIQASVEYHDSLEMVKAEAQKNMEQEDIHRMLSKIYFESRKAAEYRIAQEKKKKKK